MGLNRLLLFVLIFSTGILKAQTDFRPGFIIKESGDTLYGQIDYRGDVLMSSICKFQGADTIINVYSPNDIIAYRFIDSKYYVSREIKSKKVFLEYLIKGEINIYYLRDDIGDHYYLDKEGIQLTEIPYEEGIKHVDDKNVSYKSKTHIAILNYYMQDATDFQSRIASMGKPEHESLIKLAEDYHNEVCKDRECIIYEKKQPFLKVNLEFAGGVVNFWHVENINDRFYFQGGIIGHLWMPRTNEKLYFRTGLLYSRLEFSGVKSNYFKIPCQLEYIYPKGNIRPSFAYGLNFYYPSYRSVSFNLGTNIKLKENIFLSTNLDIEFTPLVMILPQDLLSYSVNIGIIYKL